jgi:DNA-binding response OmpR family regulator
MEGYGLRVLVVEDDAEARQALTMVLERDGYNVFTSGDGMEALGEMMKRHYDVILTDYQMPRLNGLEILAFSREFIPGTPVILISGAHPSLEQVTVERGAFAWICKSAPMTQVLPIVHAAVERARTGYGAKGVESGLSPESSPPDEHGALAAPAVRVAT